MSSQSEEPVVATADDAILSKLSCVRLHYYEDPFLEAMFHKKKCRRSPIINRGYYVRVAAFDKLIVEFLSLALCGKHSKKQIVSLGGGLDTTFWRLHRMHPQLFDDRLLRYIEIDYLQTCSRKIMLLKRNESLFLNQNALSSAAKIDVKNGSIVSDRYCLAAGDLSRWHDLVQQLHEQQLIRYDVPTLFVSECVLIYMPWQRSQAVIASTAKLFTSGVAFSVYEQILPTDAFGQTMIKNLNERGLQLMSYTQYPTLQAQQQRFLDNGYDIAVAWDLNRIYTQYLSRADTKRVEQIEMFDEFEEWHLFMAHYFISVNVFFPKCIQNRKAPTITAAEQNDEEQKTASGAEEEQKNQQQNDATDDNEEQNVKLKENWCKIGFIHQHYNPQPAIIPTRKVALPSLQKT